MYACHYGLVRQLKTDYLQNMLRELGPSYLRLCPVEMIYVQFCPQTANHVPKNREIHNENMLMQYTDCSKAVNIENFGIKFFQYFPYIYIC